MPQIQNAAQENSVYRACVLKANVVEIRTAKAVKFVSNTNVLLVALIKSVAGAKFACKELVLSVIVAVTRIVLQASYV